MFINPSTSESCSLDLILKRTFVKRKKDSFLLKGKCKQGEQFQLIEGLNKWPFNNNDTLFRVTFMYISHLTAMGADENQYSLSTICVAGIILEAQM